MKIQNLAIIFILIIMPITIVFTQYVDNQIKTIQTENTYDSRLLNATYDTIKAYQLNTINNANSDIPYSKVDDIETAVSAFYNSLITSFRYDGYDTSVMDEYIPAVAFTMYDGYYIYQPFYNTLTQMSDDEVDTKDYADGSLLNGLKPYIYYDCRYVDNEKNIDVVITYTLDNYITIDGTIGDDYVYDSGYLVDGIIDNNDGSYTYDGITFTDSDTEELKEYVGNEEYSYTKIDGTKFYLDEKEGLIFFIDESGEKHKEVENTSGKKELFDAYNRAIKQNKDGYTYYKDAYEFTKKVKDQYGLDDLIVGDAVTYDFDDPKETKIFDFSDNPENYIQCSNSYFNNHRAQVIRKVIETNLSTAISSYAKYGAEGTTYIMPNISETDWDLITNNICVATFMQGMSIGGKIYNGYSVVANNLTKEYVDEDDIYILTSDYTYHRANDNTLTSNTMMTRNDLGYYPGVLKLGFERRLYVENDKTIYYYPMSYEKNSGNILPYLGSYTSIIGSTDVSSIAYTDMYRYMHSLSNDSNYNNLRKTYYLALGRERTQAYNVENDLTNNITTGSTGSTSVPGSEDVSNWYYLSNYYVTDVPDAEGTLEYNHKWAQSVWVTANLNDTNGYIVQMKKNDGDWEEENKIRVTKNGTTVYARLYDGINSTSKNNISTYIDNIDKSKPEWEYDPNNLFSSSTINSDGMSISFTATDDESGIARIIVECKNVDSGITYYPFTEDGIEYYDASRSDEYGRDTGPTSVDFNEQITGLPGGKYDITITIVDYAGGSMSSITGGITLSAVPDTTGQITFGNPTWANDGTATTTLSTDTGYQIEYQVNSTDGEWIKGTTVTGLTHGDIIYARLTDGTNSAVGEPERHEIVDKVAPTIGKVIGSRNIGKSATISVTNIEDKGGSGLSGIYISTDNTRPSADSPGWIENTTDSYTTSEVTADTTYYVWVKDGAGNVSEGKSAKAVKVTGNTTMATLTGGTIIVGESTRPTLSYDGSPKDISFSTSDSSIATVNTTTGVVTGVSPGTATITVRITNSDNSTVTATCTINVIIAVAQIDTTYYPSLTSAINSVTTSDSTTIKLLMNTTESVTIPGGRNITLNLNGKTLTATSLAHTITNNGNLTISGNGTIRNANTDRSDVARAIYNTGTLTIINGTLRGERNWTLYNYGGTVTMNGGEVKHEGTIDDGTAAMNENGTFTMTNGKITSTEFGFVTRGSSATSKVTAATISSTGDNATVVTDNGGYSEFYNTTISNETSNLAVANYTSGVGRIYLIDCSIKKGSVGQNSNNYQGFIIELKGTADGYTAIIYDSNNSYSEVRLPTWADAEYENGNKNETWHTGRKTTLNGTTAWYYDVKKSEHKNSTGKYTTHFYDYVSGNSQFICGFYYNVD